MLLRPTVVLFVFSVPAMLVAQDIPWIKVSTQEAAGHLLKKVDPVYPEFAKAAGVEGVVRFRVSIYADGHIRGVFLPAGGPPALASAAQKALEGYLYKPFENDGKPANANTEVEVRFKLPQGLAHHDYPLPALTFESFFDRSAVTGSTAPFSSLTVRLKTWYREALRTGYKDSFDESELNARIAEAIDSTQVDLIPGGHSSAYSESRVYVFQPGGLGGAHNHPAMLVEERGNEVVLIANESMNGYFLRPRAGSVWPDVFFSSHLGMMDIDFVGFANIGGQWGQLYCGNLKAEDQSSPPVVTACRPPDI